MGLRRGALGDGHPSRAALPGMVQRRGKQRLLFLIQKFFVKRFTWPINNIFLLLLFPMVMMVNRF